MELVFIVIALIVFAVLAVRYGHDSREVIQSKEAQLAWFGMQWPAGRPTPLVRQLSRTRRVRRHLARALLALAEWLSPGTPAALRTS
jgi:hypothetical protein